MSNLAIIPARGGSKRIPRKNIKDFLGKPIIAYSIETALNSCLFDEVMVSTEDDEIAQVAQAYGAKVPFFRSADNASDFSTTIDVIREVLKQYKERSFHFDSVCCIYPTAPFIRENSLKQGLQKLKENGFITVFPVVAFNSPIWRGLKIESDGIVRMIWPENLRQRSQDLQKAYYDAGQWYWLDPNAITDAIYSTRSGVIVVNSLEVQDIDTMEDWKLAEMKYLLLNNSCEQL